MIFLVDLKITKMLVYFMLLNNHVIQLIAIIINVII